MRPSSSSMGLAAGSCTANGPGEAAVPPPARQQRSQWPSAGTFILASVGSAIGFGNIWRFPMMLYTRGGGAFMLPYLIALFLAAIPMVVLEFALGQRLQRGHVAMIAHIAPRWVGIGWASVIGTFLLAQFYSVLLAYVLVYLAGSGLNPQPWAAPASLYNASSTGGDTVFTSADTLGGINATSAGLSAGAAEAAAHRARMRESSRMARLFWEASVLHMSASIDETGGVVGTLALAYFVVLSVVCLGVVNGAKSIGILNKVLMPMPFVVLLAFFARAVTLPGASHGIGLLFVPDVARLADPSIWVAAVSQLFFGVSAGLGTLTTYASYTPPGSPVVGAAILVALANSAFSIFAGVTVFGFLGFLSHATDVPVPQIVASGPALAFQIFPIAFGLMPLPQLWAFLFFLMLLNLGISSAVSMTSPLILSLSEARGWRTSRLAPALHLLAYVTGLIYVTRAGNYWLELSDHFVPMFLTIIIGLAQCVLVARGYGARRLLSELHPDDQHLARWWAFSWRLLLPILLSILLVCQIVAEAATPFGGYPPWALTVGWLLSCGPLLLVPFFYCRTRRPGTPRRARSSHGGTRGVGRFRAGGRMTELAGVRLVGEEGAAELAGEMPASPAAGKAAGCGVGHTAVGTPAQAGDMLVGEDGWSSTAAEWGGKTIESPPAAGEKVRQAASIAPAVDED